MINKIRSLPLPLKIVFWWSIVGEILTILAALVNPKTNPSSSFLLSVVQLILGLLLVVGIIQRSKSVRTLMLVCGWLAGILSALGFLAALLKGNFVVALIQVLPVASCFLLVTCLLARSTKIYFGLINESEGPPLLPNQSTDPTL
jgi:heme A synthase